MGSCVWVYVCVCLSVANLAYNWTSITSLVRIMTAHGPLAAAVRLLWFIPADSSLLLTPLLLGKMYMVVTLVLADSFVGIIHFEIYI